MFISLGTLPPSAKFMKLTLVESVEKGEEGRGTT
jgi:hypothetical protein